MNNPIGHEDAKLVCSGEVDLTPGSIFGDAFQLSCQSFAVDSDRHVL